MRGKTRAAAAKPYPQWTATSAKRKRTYEDTATAIEQSPSPPAASDDDKMETPERDDGSSPVCPTLPNRTDPLVCLPPPSKVKNIGGFLVGPPPPSKVRKTGGFVPKQKAVQEERGPSIDWVERKTQLSNFPNDLYVDVLMDGIIEVFMIVAKEFRETAGEVGPSMLWHLLPAVMDAIQKTPWSYFVVSEEDQRLCGKVADPCVMFINFTWGDRGQELSIGQNKFRKVILSKVKEYLSNYFNSLFTTIDVQVIYSKKFFDSI